jgi:N-methylhydantoinase A
MGGTEPTTTDANLLLGRLGATLIDGEMGLDATLAERAIADRIATPLGLSVTDAASAVVQVANANMADALRLISIRRGYDPRDFALVVFGGAGPLHGVALARELSIPTVIVPLDPGIASAFGCLLVDVRHDLSRMYLADPATVDPAELEGAFSELEAEAARRLDAEEVPAEQREIVRTIDMRYRGQWRSLSVPAGRPLRTLDDAIATFHAEHEREYNYRRDDMPVEIYRIGVQAIGVTPKPQLARHALSGAVAAPAGTRPVYFEEEAGFIETPIYRRADLPAGARFEGPAIVEQLDSTTVVPPGVSVAVDEWLNLRIDLRGDR